MTIDRCIHEDELLDALSRGFVADDLATHAAGCSSCSELRVVAGALLDDRIHAIGDSHVPSSAVAWWRIQMRERQEVEGRARQSLFIGQAATLSIALALVLALFGGDAIVLVAETITAVRLSTPILLAIAIALILAPIGGYVAITQK